jgi:hypothetical protein
MSVLATPRIHFRGTFMTNVDTANNDNPGLEYVHAGPVTLDTHGISDADFRTFLMGSDQNGLPGGWNYFGDNGCRFDTTTVTAVELHNGEILTTPQDDPFVGAVVQLGPQQPARNTGVMVDVDPEGSLGTQIFSDEMRAQAGTTVLWRGRPGRMYSRWLFFGRNLGTGGFTAASAVWQAGIPASALTYGASASRGLQALQQVATRGILVRFCTYLLQPRIPTAQLIANFQAGNHSINPAFGVVVGTIGPWEDGELASIPEGRRLHQSRLVSSAHGDVRLGPAVARVDRTRQVVSLDLVTTFPEQDTTLVKVNVGPVSLALQPADGSTPVVLGPVPYDQASYERMAGVVDVPYPPEVEGQLDDGELQLRLDTLTVDCMREVPITVETDDRGVYLQEGETGTIAIQVRQKGAAPGAPLQIGVEQYPITDSTGPGSPAAPGEEIVTVTDHVDVDADGHGQLSLTGLTGGNCLIRFVLPGDVPGRFNSTLSAFANVRVLPRDDFSSVPDADVTFAFVYEQVLRYYWVLYPTMDRFVDFSDEQSMVGNADSVLARIAKERWHDWVYMPRTRELSDGKRALLERWLRMQL